MTSQSGICVLEELSKARRSVPTAIIVLVHGTAARGAEWTQLDSPLCQAVIKSSYDVYRFLWSGDNSHDARLTAGKCFEEKLTELVGEPRNEGVPLFVVAHSHGGNVSLYGLRGTLRERVSGVVCLATPFLHFFPATLGTRFLFFVAGVYFIGALFLVSVLLFLGLPPVMFLVVVAAILVVLIFLLHKLRRMGLRFPPRKMLREMFKADIEQLEKELELPELERQKLFIIKPVADEAAGALVSSQFSAWVARQIWGFLGRFWENKFILAIGAFVVALWGVAFLLPASFHQSLSTIGLVIIVAIMTAVGIVASLLLLIIILANGSFGYDALALAFRGQTAAESSPPGKAVVVSIALSGFRHSEIYKDCKAIDQVATFISGEPPRASQKGKRE
jgi:Alpha/beta hydrolase family